MWWPPIRRLTT
ncbi:hypothetical protein CgunFtcFv8_024955 [Champsocephalus gunnari]|uniref:Uncharacterized protein n=1 Tax=Champsocephalus gunnari TaxID=52237 RepID=A0AAN8HRA7_CHAGU|nr:hypothetical protein CgunFtcFv8_024955 [Champsocephalus gunnari]